MPPNNRFRHQEYLCEPRTSCVRPRAALADTPRAGSDAWRADLRAAGDRLRSADVGALWLAHGTFAGDDPFGVWRQFEKFGVRTGLARRAQKAVTDVIMRDVGNYTSRYATELADGLDGRRLADLNGAPLGESAEAERAPGDVPLSVRRWTWSSQNNHVGRADGALRFVVDLARHAPSDGRRLLAWGHSHAGNVLALVTNLLAASDVDLDRFFTATRPYYEGLFGASPPAASTWHAARALLTEPRDRARLRAIPLDIVTFGTPIRYGWDSTGYARLLHVVHHRPEHVRPRRERGFPFGLLDAWRAYEGDYVQRFGIAGTNFAPCWMLRRAARRADRALHAIIQSEVTSRGLFERLRPALRTADEGLVWTTDYGDLRGGPLAHLIGHGVYTNRRWMSFHARLVGEWLQESTGAKGSEGEPDGGNANWPVVRGSTRSS